MKTAILGAVAGLFLTAQAWAQSTETLIQGVISQQLEAFQADDIDRAFGYASPMIESIFGTAENFARMVQNGYPMVWRPANVEFTGVETRSGRVLQNVLITDSKGALHLLEYEMVETENGWEINGVKFKRPGGLGA